MPTVSIYVAAHKQEALELPEGYRVCQVNALKNGAWPGSCVHDSDGADNISAKNDRYCELTALYRLWKYDDSDIKGLAHYRRYFSGQDGPNFGAYLLDRIPAAELRERAVKPTQIVKYLQTHDILVEFPRSPCLVNAYEDLLRFVYPQDIRALSEVIHACYPAYEDSYRAVLRSTHLSYLNMFIAGKEQTAAYCEWLFGVLGKVEERIDVEGYDAQHRRVFGYLAEVLLNVWILKNRLRVKYLYTLLLTGEEVRHKPLRKLPFFPRIVQLRLFCADREDYRLKQKRFASVCAACKAPYSVTLDRVYQAAETPEDVLAWYARHYRSVRLSKEAVTVSSRSYEYALVLTENSRQYAYLQSNNRCIASVWMDRAEDLEPFIETVEAMYRDTYTVNIRVVTQSRELMRELAARPEVYGYFRG